MATVVDIAAARVNNPANAQTYTTPSFTPSANVLLLAIASLTGTAATCTVTDSLGGTWTLVRQELHSGSSARDAIYVRGALTGGSAMTVTIDTGAADPATGCSMAIAEVTAMSKVGAAAIRQSEGASNQAAGGTPTDTFTSACLTENPTVGLVGAAANPPTITPPTDWTERADMGHATPVAGLEYVSRDSGFTGQTITWGSTSSAAFGVVIVELDTSAGSPALPSPGRGHRRLVMRGRR